jgi:transposase
MSIILMLLQIELMVLQKLESNLRNNIDVIPSKCNAVNPIEYDKHMHKERHIIECFFSKIKYFRRIFSRFDKSARNFLAFLSLVGVCIWLR